MVSEHFWANLGRISVALGVIGALIAIYQTVFPDKPKLIARCEVHQQDDISADNEVKPWIILPQLVVCTVENKGAREARDVQIELPSVPKFAALPGQKWHSQSTGVLSLGSIRPFAQVEIRSLHSPYDMIAPYKYDKVSLTYADGIGTVAMARPIATMSDALEWFIASRYFLYVILFIVAVFIFSNWDFIRQRHLNPQNAVLPSTKELGNPTVEKDKRDD